MFMRNVRRVPALLTGLVLTAALVSGCDENEDSEEPDTEETTETPDEEEPEDDATDEDETEEPEESDDDAEPVAEEEPDDASWATLGECPIDVPEPAGQYEVINEHPVDGEMVFCTVEVEAEHDVATHWDSLSTAFDDEGASQVEDNPANDPTDPNDISIQAWTLDDYEVIVNFRPLDTDSTNLIYVVRDPGREG